MKKILMCGVASLALAAIPVFGAFAEAPQSGNSETGYFVGSKNATVGDVDETIYSVDLTWGDMVFDWKYDENTNGFNFQEQPGVKQLVSTMGDGFDWLTNEKDKGFIYEDESCRTRFTGEIADGVSYYWCPAYDASGVVKLSDNSINGRVKATASFTPSDDYDWVTGRFGLWEMNSGNLVFNESENGEFQQYVDTNWDGSSVVYTMLDLKLEKNEEALGSTSVSTSDRIGTVIISIEPDLD